MPRTVSVWGGRFSREGLSGDDPTPPEYVCRRESLHPSSRRGIGVGVHVELHSHAKEQINDIIADHPDTAIHVMLDNFPAPEPLVTTTTATTDTTKQA
jgi:hypothetical protein